MGVDQTRKNDAFAQIDDFAGMFLEDFLRRSGIDESVPLHNKNPVLNRLSVHGGEPAAPITRHLE
jgi:hypothetical protein